MNRENVKPMQSTRATWGLFLFVGLLVFSGCASAGPSAQSVGQPLVFQKGQVAPQSFLSSVIVVKGGCQPFGAACTISGPTGATIILPRTEGMPEWLYEVFAHEMCHALAGVKGHTGKADPCHNEDGGVIRAHAAQVDLTSFRPR